MNALPFVQFLSELKLDRLIPAPDRFYTSAAGSIFAAAAFGAVYGLVGRVIYPNARISPLHYAIWFTTAFQIKYSVNFIENQFEKFMGVGAYLDELEKAPEDELDLEDRIRCHCWKVIQFRNTALKKIDGAISGIFNIRPYQVVTADNVSDASFLEMCRYRVWRVFKWTILDTISFSIAYRLTNGMGFTLPARTSVPLFIVMSSIVRDILLIPSLYLYARFCNDLAEELGESDQRASHYRAVWLRNILPAL